MSGKITSYIIGVIGVSLLAIFTIVGACFVSDPFARFIFSSQAAIMQAPGDTQYVPTPTRKPFQPPSESDKPGDDVPDSQVPGSSQEPEGSVSDDGGDTRRPRDREAPEQPFCNKTCGPYQRCVHTISGGYCVERQIGYCGWCAFGCFVDNMSCAPSASEVYLGGGGPVGGIPQVPSPISPDLPEIEEPLASAPDLSGQCYITSDNRCLPCQTAQDFIDRYCLSCDSLICRAAREVGEQALAQQSTCVGICVPQIAGRTSGEVCRYGTASGTCPSGQVCCVRTSPSTDLSFADQRCLRIFDTYSEIWEGCEEVVWNERGERRFEFPQPFADIRWGLNLIGQGFERQIEDTVDLWIESVFSGTNTAEDWANRAYATFNLITLGTFDGVNQAWGEFRDCTLGSSGSSVFVNCGLYALSSVIQTFDFAEPFLGLTLDDVARTAVNNIDDLWLQVRYGLADDLDGVVRHLEDLSGNPLAQIDVIENLPPDMQRRLLESRPDLVPAFGGGLGDEIAAIQHRIAQNLSSEGVSYDTLRDLNFCYRCNDVANATQEVIGGEIYQYQIAGADPTIHFGDDYRLLAYAEGEEAYHTFVVRDGMVWDPVLNVWGEQTLEEYVSNFHIPSDADGFLINFDQGIYQRYPPPNPDEIVRRLEELSGQPEEQIDLFVSLSPDMQSDVLRARPDLVPATGGGLGGPVDTYSGSTRSYDIYIESRGGGSFQVAALTEGQEAGAYVLHSNRARELDVVTEAVNTGQIPDLQPGMEVTGGEVMVYPDFRREGLGTELVRQGLDEMLSRGNVRHIVSFSPEGSTVFHDLYVNEYGYESFRVGFTTYYYRDY